MFRAFIAAIIFITQLLDSTHAADLNVACRRGQPPFSDSASLTAKTCEGLYAEVFYRIVADTNLTYTMSMIETSNIDPFLDSTPNHTKYDMIITFHTVTPERLALYDFTVAISQSSDVVALSPKFYQVGLSFVDSVISTSIIYLFGLIGVIIAMMAIIILIFESPHETSDLQKVQRWRRPLWALEMAFECVMTSSSSEMLVSQVTRTFRVLAALAGVFLVTILGSVITARMTTSSMASAVTLVTDLRGSHIAVASGTLVDFLQSTRVGATTTLVPNLEHFAQEFFVGNQPEFDGFSTSAEVVMHFFHKLQPSSKYTVTPVYYTTGTYSLKAMPFNRNIRNKTLKSLFDIHLQGLREDGTLAQLVNKYVNLDGIPDPTAVNSDIPVESAASLAFVIINGVLYGIAAMLIAGTAGYHKVYLPYFASTEAVAKELERRQSIRMTVLRHFEWKGESHQVINEELAQLLDYVASKLPAAEEEDS